MQRFFVRRPISDRNMHARYSAMRNYWYRELNRSNHRRLDKQETVIMEY
jgi:hypothetical protein